MPTTNPSVDGYIRKHKRWQEELEALRAIVLDSGLTEDIKWRTPCYTLDGGNVVMIGAWKDGCSLSFLKGSLLKDPKKILEKPGENTRAARMVRFTSVKDIARLKPVLKAYLREAIELEKADMKVDFTKDAALPVPAEVQQVFEAKPAWRSAFEALTPGRQRGYLLHFAAAKQAKTRVSRLEKAMPRILEGKGLHDYE